MIVISLFVILLIYISPRTTQMAKEKAWLNKDDIIVRPDEKLLRVVEGMELEVFK